MLQATAQVRRRLAELELDMDRQQGWVRGGTKSEVSLLQCSACVVPQCLCFGRAQTFGQMPMHTDTVLVFFGAYALDIQNVSLSLHVDGIIPENA